MADIESLTTHEALRSLKNRQLLLRAIPLNDLNPDLPPGFAPEQVIYREIAPDLTRPLGLRYRILDEATPIDDAFPGIEQFAMNAAAGHYHQNRPILAEDNPLSITVDKDSYVILHLAREYADDWQFCAGAAGVVLGPAAGTTNPWSFYGDLKYVKAGEQPSDLPMAGCQLVYFAARFVTGTKPNPYRQKFLFLVDIEEETTVHVDPDIRYPGNNQP